MVWCQSIPYVAAPDARILILGSMLGARSLEIGQYYAHPQNNFWPLIFTLLDIPLPDQYDDRVRGLLEHGIALWDVIASCNREGSSDASITDVTTNDFTGFFALHPHIRLVALNGGKAAQLWQRYVHMDQADLPIIKLPSTSPAHTRPLAEKIEAWSVIRDYL